MARHLDHTPYERPWIEAQGEVVRAQRGTEGVTAAPSKTKRSVPSQWGDVSSRDVPPPGSGDALRLRLELFDPLRRLLRRRHLPLRVRKSGVSDGRGSSPCSRSVAAATITDTARDLGHTPHEKLWIQARGRTSPIGATPYEPTGVASP